MKYKHAQTPWIKPLDLYDIFNITLTQGLMQPYGWPLTFALWADYLSTLIEFFSIIFSVWTGSSIKQEVNEQEIKRHTHTHTHTHTQERTLMRSHWSEPVTELRSVLALIQISSIVTTNQLPVFLSFVLYSFHPVGFLSSVTSSPFILKAGH